MKLFRKIFYHFWCKKIIKNNIFKREKYNDRNVLEQIIFPHILSHHNPKKILDIGREDYQAFYNDFFKNKELWTMDIDPDRKEFGAPQHHITDDVKNIKKHFQNNYFDFILINGVLGWGLNRKDDAEKTFESIVEILKPGGVLIIGWNNFKDIKVINPKEITALKKLKPFYFKPLKTDCFCCSNGEHTYNFYIK